MSCEYDVFCETCKELLGLDVNRGDDLMQALIRQRQLLVELYRLGNRILNEIPHNYDLVVGLALYTSADQQVSLGFFDKHEHHELVVRDEYGRITRVEEHK